MNFIFPLSTYLKITQIYHSAHLGMDFGWHDMNPAYNNQAIVAAEAGTVIDCGDGYGNTYPNRRIYGNYVIISHGHGYWTVYGHLLKGLAVSKGQYVRKGQTIGYMGNTGYSNGQHLHFEIRVGANSKSNSKDPLNYLMLEDRGIYVNPDTKFPDRIKYRPLGIGTPVDRDTSKLQIEVITETLNARKAPGTKSERLGYMAKGVFNIISEQTEGDYTWAEVEKNIWLAEKEGVYTNRYEPVTPATLFTVTFPTVSLGDKNYLEAVAKTMQLEIEIKEKT